MEKEREKRAARFLKQMGWRVLFGGKAGKFVRHEDMIEIPEEFSEKDLESFLQTFLKKDSEGLNTQDLVRYVLCE